MRQRAVIGTVIFVSAPTIVLHRARLAPSVLTGVNALADIGSDCSVDLTRAVVYLAEVRKAALGQPQVLLLLGCQRWKLRWQVSQELVPFSPCRRRDPSRLRYQSVRGEEGVHVYAVDDHPTGVDDHGIVLQHHAAKRDALKCLKPLGVFGVPSPYRLAA